MARVGYNPKLGIIKTDVDHLTIDRASIAHWQVLAADATVATINGIHLAKTCPAISVKATCVIKGAVAPTDILTISSTIPLGSVTNALKVSLVTAADDTLAVTKSGQNIIISLAKTTASKNAAANIQTAIQALTTVGTPSVNVSAMTCVAGGNWDTATIATGEADLVSFSGGILAVDLMTTGITQPSVPRNITATTDGTAGDIKPVQVTITGTNYQGDVITEALPVFTENTKTTVVGAKAFKTITSISIPAHDGLGATTAIGFGEVLGLPYLLPYNTVISSFFDNAPASGAPTVTTSLTAIESNTLDMHNALNSKIVDVYLMV